MGKSLKPRCACTGVVLWLNAPPDISIKVKRKLHDMRMAVRRQNCGSTKYGTIHMASFVTHHYKRYLYESKGFKNFRI